MEITRGSGDSKGYQWDWWRSDVQHRRDCKIYQETPRISLFISTRRRLPLGGHCHQLHCEKKLGQERATSHGSRKQLLRSTDVDGAYRCGSHLTRGCWDKFGSEGHVCSQ